LQPADLKEIGLLTLLAGSLILMASTYRAYVFPITPVSSTDLGTILTQAWQGLVITISLTILGILAVLTGTILYGFGRLAEELQSSQTTEEAPDATKHHPNSSPKDR
jgi:hypothetical protein